MAEQEFSFDGLERVVRQNSMTVAPLVRKKNKEGKWVFRISQLTFDQMNLNANSLDAFATKDRGKVYSALCPGDTGSFAKARKGKEKGNVFKHDELSSFIDGAGLKGNDFDVKKAGEANGMVYYQLAEHASTEGYQEPSGSGTEKVKKAKPAPTPAPVAQ